jgi:hypothetical protein
MQAPGGPDEDRTGGFEHGGWSFPYGDEDFGVAVTGWFSHADAFLLGRTTYEIFAGYWPAVTDAGDPIAGKRNALPKYVASTTLSSVDWEPASLTGDVAAGWPGSGQPATTAGTAAAGWRDADRHDLIDEYRLLTFGAPGLGKKLFREGRGGGHAPGQRSMRAPGWSSPRTSRTGQRSTARSPTSPDA